MKRFIFRLETLLKHRKTLQELRDQEFALAQGRHEQAKEMLDTLEAHWREIVSQRPVADGNTQFDAPAIQSREKYVETLQLRIGEQAERVELARLIAEEKRLAMVAAKQAYEAVSQLHDKDFADYQAETQRKTQESLDEIGAVRFARQQIEESVQRTETAQRQRQRQEADASERIPGQDGRKAA